MKKVLLLGLGNELRSDDAVGLRVVRQVQEQMKNMPDEPVSSQKETLVDIMESEEMGLALLDYITGYDELVLVDSLQTGKVPPGSLHELGEEDLKVVKGLSPHYLGISEVWALGHATGLPMPRRLKIFAVEVKDPFTVGTQLSPEVNETIPGLVFRVIQYLMKISERGRELK